MFKVIKSFGREIYKDELALEDALEEQIKFKTTLINLNNLQNQKP